MNRQAHKLQVPRAICVGLIGIAWALAAINVAVNVRGGQRLSLDEAGWALNGLIVGGISLGPVVLMSVAGRCFSARRWAWGFLASGLMLPFLAFNMWNSNQFVADQMLGKIQLQEAKAVATKEVADTQNSELIKSKHEAEANLWRVYLTEKDNTKRASIMEELKAIRTTPIALIAPLADVPRPLGARDTWLSKRLGVDRETIEGITPAAVPLLMQVAEVFFSLLGFGLWPVPTSLHQASSKFDQPRASRDSARAHVIALVDSGQEIPSGVHMAKLWNVSPQTAGNWLREFRKEGICRRERQGNRLAIVRPKRLNGNGIYSTEGNA